MAAHHAGGGVQQGGWMLALEHVPVGLHKRGHEHRVACVYGHMRRVRSGVTGPEVIAGPRQRCVCHPAMSNTEREPSPQAHRPPLGLLYAFRNVPTTQNIVSVQACSTKLTLAAGGQRF